MDNYGIVFKTAYQYMRKQCGDGWSIIVSEDYKNLADMFEILYGNLFEERNDDDNYISFSNKPEESVSFSNKIPEHIHGVYACVIVI